eukprot:TRINITY_DN3518_c0_g1_i1.p1 TRINITY_DN3518_c0_g1~~TRINITY_DN3518_c0_g1_i1.p1  ORF type:complete len:638 (-),score=74.13 TRINITY_DN3518_c0_g1_i1:909-2822(-)
MNMNNKRSVRSSSNYTTLPQQITSGTQGFYSKYIYHDLIKLRHKSRPTRNNMGTTIAGSCGPLYVGSVKNTQESLHSHNSSQLSERALDKIEEIMARRAQPVEIPSGPAKIDQAVQLSPIENSHNPAKASILLSDKKCSLAELLVSGDGRRGPVVDTETCRHTDNKFTIGADGKCTKVSDGSHFIGSNSKGSRKSCIRVINAATSEKENKKRDCIVEEVLFSGEDDLDSYDKSVDIGTAEFKNPLDNNSKDPEIKLVLKEKEAHIEILRKLLTKSMKIIKSLRDQITLLSAKKGGKIHPQLLGKLEDVLAGEVTEGNLEEIGNFLDALQNVTTAENEHLLSKKVELLAEKYGDEAKSLAETLVKLTSRTLGGGTNQFASPAKLLRTKAANAAGIDTTLSPIRTPGKSPTAPQHMSVHNEIMDLYRQAEEEMERKNVCYKEKGNLQMTFQQEDEKTKRSNEKVESTSRSIKNWKTFVAGASESEEEPEEVQKRKRRHNRSCAAGGALRRNIRGDLRISVKGMPRRREDKENSSPEEGTNRSKKPKTDHRKLEESLSIQSPQDDNFNETNPNNDTLDENLTHIEAAMSNFLGGFKDIKSELSQLGEVMQSCSQYQVPKSPTEDYQLLLIMFNNIYFPLY